MDFLILGFLGVMFAFLLRQRELGPHGHGLETITTKNGREDEVLGLGECRFGWRG